MEQQSEPTDDVETGISSPTQYNFPASDVYQISDPGPQGPLPPPGPPACRLDITFLGLGRVNNDIVIRLDVRKVWGTGIYIVAVVVRERHISLDANLLSSPSGGIYGWSPLLMREEWREAYYVDPATNARLPLSASETFDNCPRTVLAQFTFPVSALEDRFIEIEAQAWCCEDDPRNLFTSRTHRGILVPSS